MIVFRQQQKQKKTKKIQERSTMKTSKYELTKYYNIKKQANNLYKLVFKNSHTHTYTHHNPQHF